MSTDIMTASASELSAADANLLLDIARQALSEAVANDREWEPDLNELPPALREPGACFVTLTTAGALHGCIGSVEARRPLAVDVAHNAGAAALRDPRFPPLRAAELDTVEIEVSVLSPLQPVSYRDINDLTRKVRPHIDGVLATRGWQRGLLLPQVWEKLPDPHEFLAHVALKAGASPAIYADPATQVYTFQVHSYVQPAPGNEPH